MEKNRRALLAAAGGILLAPGVDAQTPAWPTRAVKLIVPFTPGGSNDVLGRIVGQKLSEYWGQPVLVENRPGVGGNLGASLVAKAPADGYTLLVAPGNLLTINPFLYEKDKVGYDPVKDLAPISFMGVAPIVLAVNPKVPAQNVRELITLASAKAGAVNYASAGVGTPQHLSAELFASMAGVRLTHVPYKGAVPAITDLVGGLVQMMFGIINSLLPHIRNGAVRALGVGGRQSLAALPGVPPVADTLPGFLTDSWTGLMAPAGTPREVIAKVGQGIARALGEPDVREKLTAQGIEPTANSAAEFAAIIGTETLRWAKVIKETGARAE
ncbi:MAG: Bug family tripartite tricarboxylate transporter substrate binding protein [Betaproteobacteria bacterium]